MGYMKTFLRWFRRNWKRLWCDHDLKIIGFASDDYFHMEIFRCRKCNAIVCKERDNFNG